MSLSFSSPLLISWNLEVLLPTYIDYASTHFGYTFHRYEYRWADGVTIKKPIEVSAPKYVEYLMDWIEAQLDDESLFPQRIGEWNFLTELVVHSFDLGTWFYLSYSVPQGINLFLCYLLQGHPSHPISMKLSRQFLSDCSVYMRTSITHIFRRLWVWRKKLISTLASNTLFSLHG